VHLPVVAWLPGPGRTIHFRNHAFVFDVPRYLSFRKQARDIDGAVENVIEQKLRNQIGNPSQCGFSQQQHAVDETALTCE